MKDYSKEVKLLEQFLINKDLEDLEGSLSKFNIFEAIGVIKQELKHSDFLAYLLNPNQNHGLREVFLKKFLQQCSMRIEDPNTNAIEIDTADYSLAEVQREWKHIDILITVPSINLVCVIENKIYSGEGAKQLLGYKNLILEEYSKNNFKHLFIFLTPEGIPASDDDWLAMSYFDIADILKNINEFIGISLDKDIYSLINHYIAMLERHIITESKFAELCRKIYKSHKQAIDLINTHKPDIQQDISEYLKELIKENKNITSDDSSKTYIRFAPKEWEKFKFQKMGKGWTKSGRMLLFEFINYQGFLNIKLTIGRGDQVERMKLYDIAKGHPRVFKVPKTPTMQYSTIYSKKILKENDYEEFSKEDLFKKINEAWIKFLKDDYPKIFEIMLGK